MDSLLSQYKLQYCLFAEIENKVMLKFTKEQKVSRQTNKKLGHQSHS